MTRSELRPLYFAARQRAHDAGYAAAEAEDLATRRPTPANTQAAADAWERAANLDRAAEAILTRAATLPD